MIERTEHVERVLRLLRDRPVVAILGARQVGKTTLAGAVARARRGPVQVFDLGDPAHLAAVADARLTLPGLRGLVVIDELQHRPELFPLLRVLADRPGRPARFLVLGSASPELLRQGSETLAGRIAFHPLRGFALDEIGAARADRLWLRGGFPPAFLARTEEASRQWRRDFVTTFLVRDLPAFGVTVPPATLRRFWTMLAHYHAQIWNGSELARAFGVGHTTVQRYVETLAATFVVRRLSPWFENIGKRQVRAPKVYIADSGLLHSLLGIATTRDLWSHPKVGASFEGFALEQVIARLGARAEECYYWATHTGAELDLLVIRGRRRLGFEFKRTSAPRLTPSMRSALAGLKLDRLDVVYPGETTFPLAVKVRAVALARLLEDVRPMR